MLATLHQVDCLDDATRDAWRRMQAENPDLSSPFFRLEFAEALARVRQGVSVIVLTEQGEIRALLPLQLLEDGIAAPLGEKVGCFHGLIGSSELHLDIGKLLRACGLSAWKFDHLLASQRSFSKHHYEVLDSPFLDLRQGFQGYKQQRKDAGHSNRTVDETLRKQRKLEREFKSVRFEIDSHDKALLHELIDWKRQQMSTTGIRDLFVESPWIVPFLENSLQSRDDAFRGMLSALSVDDKPIALQFGLRSNGVLHGLFIAYKHEFFKFSPGMMLTVQGAQVAPDIGIMRWDLGKGPEEFKRKLMSDSTPVAVGAVDNRRVRSVVQTAVYRTKQKLVDSPLHRPTRRLARGMARVFPPLKNWLAMR